MILEVFKGDDNSIRKCNMYSMNRTALLFLLNSLPYQMLYNNGPEINSRKTHINFQRYL